MTKRLQLSQRFHELLKENGYDENVYFQPPTTVQMDYPCIRYIRSDIYSRYADDITYMDKDRYTITVIDSNPDSGIPKMLLNNFRLISFDRQYTADNLNHFVLNLYW